MFALYKMLPYESTYVYSKVCIGMDGGSGGDLLYYSHTIGTIGETRLARGKNKSNTISATTNIIWGCSKLSETAADRRRLHIAVYITKVGAYAAAHRTSKPTVNLTPVCVCRCVSTWQVDISQFSQLHVIIVWLLLVLQYSHRGRICGVITRDHM